MTEPTDTANLRAFKAINALVRISSLAGGNIQQIALDAIATDDRLIGGSVCNEGLDAHRFGYELQPSAPSAEPAANHYYELQKANTRHLNLLLDLGRVLDGDAPICGFAEVEALYKLLGDYQSAAPLMANGPETAATASVTGLSEPNIPGLAADPSAFTRWANREGYDTSSHPLHFLFLNEKTYAARQGWNACRHHYGISDAVAAPQAAPVPTVQPLTEDELRDMASSACQEALSFGVNDDAFLRLARSVARAHGIPLATAAADPCPVSRCPCGYPQPCNITTPVGFCRSGMAAAAAEPTKE